LPKWLSFRAAATARRGQTSTSPRIVGWYSNAGTGNGRAQRHSPLLYARVGGRRPRSVGGGAIAGSNGSGGIQGRRRQGCDEVRGEAISLCVPDSDDRGGRRDRGRRGDFHPSHERATPMTASRRRAASSSASIRFPALLSGRRYGRCGCAVGGRDSAAVDLAERIGANLGCTFRMVRRQARGYPAAAVDPRRTSSSLSRPMRRSGGGSVNRTGRRAAAARDARAHDVENGLRMGEHDASRRPSRAATRRTVASKREAWRKSASGGSRVFDALGGNRVARRRGGAAAARQTVAAARGAGARAPAPGSRSGCRPTMGSFHEGHLQLMARRAVEVRRCGGPGSCTRPSRAGAESTVPGRAASTAAIASRRACWNLLFAPPVEEVYPTGSPPAG